MLRFSGTRVGEHGMIGRHDLSVLAGRHDRHAGAGDVAAAALPAGPGPGL